MHEVDRAYEANANCWMAEDEPAEIVEGPQETHGRAGDGNRNRIERAELTSRMAVR